MLTPGPTSPVEADGPGALWRRLLDWLDRLRTYGPAERRALAALESRTAGGPGQAAPLQGDPANAPAPAGLDDWLALVEFVALRGDYERAARVLARVPAGLRGEPAYDAARGAVLGDGMSRLAEMLLPGLPRRRVRQSIARTPSGQLIAVGDVVLEEVLEVREALLELKKTEASPHLVLLHMRSSLPEWRLQRFLERETAKRRPDVKDFEVRMEPGRMQVRCSFKGIPLTIGLVLELLTAQALRVRFDPSPKVLWIVPIPRSELDRALDALAAGGPPGFMCDVSGDGFVLDFSRLLAPMTSELHLRQVELLLGEVRTLAGSMESMESKVPPALAGPTTPPTLPEGAAPAGDVVRAPGPALPSPVPPAEAARAALAALSASSVLFQTQAALAGLALRPDAADDAPLARRCRETPLEPAAYRDLARQAHASGQPAVARLAFSALALLEPEDREAAEYLRAAAARPLPQPATGPDKVEWLRCPAERRLPASAVFRRLATELGWTAGPPAPPGAVEAGPDRFPQHLAWLAEAARALGAQPCRLLIVDSPEGGAFAGSDFVATPPVLASHVGRAESLFMLGRAVGHRLLGHVGLTGLPPERLAVLAGIVHQIGSGWYGGSRRFRPTCTFDAWLPPSVASELVPLCLELAPRLEIELPLWQAGMRVSADRAGLAACGNLRAAATAILASAGGPSSGLPLAKLLALSPDDAVTARFHALLPFAVLDLYGRRP